jgi:hypothetical protein
MHILPALSITQNTYRGLFYNCSNLAVGPKIQATQIIGSYSASAISNIYYSNSNLKYANTSMSSSVSSSQFTFAGSNTIKQYTSGWKNSDKSGMLYVHTGQYDGLSQGYEMIRAIFNSRGANLPSLAKDAEEAAETVESDLPPIS